MPVLRLHAIFHFAFVATPINAVGISAVHTIFNVFTTALLCPFTKQLERFANFVIRPSKKEETYAFLDERPAWHTVHRRRRGQ